MAIKSKILNSLLDFFNKSAFRKNIAVMISGNVLGAAVNMLALPILSRLYLPAQLGEYDLIVSSGQFVMGLLSLGLVIAVMLPEEDKSARHICQIILASNVGSVFILFGIFAWVVPFQLFETSMPYCIALSFLAAYMLVFNLQGVYYAYTNRCKKYRVLFWNPVLLSISFVALASMFRFLGMGTDGYFLGRIFSYVLCCIHMSRHVNPFRGSILWMDWKEVFLKYRALTFVQMPANLIGTVAKQLPLQFFGRFYGVDVLGGYMMATRILSVPVTLLATPINRVVYQTMAEKIRNGEEIGEFCFRLLKRNTQIAIVPLGLLIVSSRWLVPFIFGEAWRSTAEYIVILGPVCLLQFCSACVSGTFVATGYTGLSMVTAVAQLLLYGIYYFMYYKYSMELHEAIILVALLEFCYLFLNLLLCTWCTKYPMHKFLLFFLLHIVGGNLIIYFFYYLANYGFS